MGIFKHRHIPQVENIVLVHGVWADGSSWSGVIERLQKAGSTVTAVQLDLASLSSDVARVRQTLSAQTGPTVLVAHSFGGAIITALGKDAPNVVGLVYLSAFAPDQGETMKALVTAEPQPAVGAAIRPDTEGFLWLDRAGFVEYFAPDVNPTQARVLATVQKPIAASEFMDGEPFGEPAWKVLPSWYLVTEQDQVVPPVTQRFMAQRAGATTREVASSHVSMISHPDVVTELILTAAQATVNA
ncbi:alpha/beta hydrolase [Dictyobacter alpinus]|uniref:Alpha/beta hydrolase n=1 Tax=Dictyobacter alpinus TaxID=2014873 RepID=A0A402BDW4_9CHLR|nr:alpha/beta hydrolase [Dictyobacter alpinus]GCE29482.1 alpha/beta hydrolase [Dictyobacter alpinus]